MVMMYFLGGHPRLRIGFRLTTSYRNHGQTMASLQLAMPTFNLEVSVVYVGGMASAEFSLVSINVNNVFPGRRRAQG